MIKFIQNDELEKLSKRLAVIQSAEIKKETLRKFIEKYKFDEFIFQYISVEDGLDSEVFSTHPHITLDLIHKKPELFDKNLFLEKSNNVKLAIDKEFREEFKIYSDDIITIIARQKRVDSTILQNVDVTDDVRIISALMAKTDTSGNEFAEKKVEEIKEKHKDGIFTREVIRSGKFSPGAENIYKMFQKETLDPDLLMVCLRAATEYPICLKKIIDESFERVANGDFKQTPKANSLLDLNSSLIDRDIIVQALNILSKIDDSEESIPTSFFINFIRSRNLTEEHVSILLDLFIKKVGYDSTVTFARKKGYNNILFELAMKDSSAWETGDDEC